MKIIIPTCKVENLKPCLESIRAYSDAEVLVVANGFNDRNYLDDVGVKYLWFDERIGYTKAINEGLKATGDEDVILLNDDTIICPQAKNEWIDKLSSGDLVGAKSLDYMNKEFLIFFCVFIKRWVINKVGLLDEIFSPGYGEDIDFCLKAQALGIEQKVVKINITHLAERTILDNPKVHDIVKRNREILFRRYFHLLENNYERFVASRESPIGPRETARYTWASQRIQKKTVLDIGCSTGYGSRLLPNKIDYTGLDYDKTIIEFAKNTFPELKFINADITEFEIPHFDNIIAFEVIEHLENGREIAQKLKEKCDNLLISCPFNEPKGYWGEHHKLHGLTEADFPGFTYEYLDMSGNFCDRSKATLMLMRWRKHHIVAEISTKDRYDILPLAIQSVISQTIRPDEFIIFDDNDKPDDLREKPVFAHLFRQLTDNGIKWRVLFGQKRGQHFNHEFAQNIATDLIWRLDDDEVAEPDVLEILLSNMSDGVGAVAGLVLTPGATHKDLTNKITDLKENCQWFKFSGKKEVEHLYSSFLYRANIAHYELGLSKVAHREETLFSHEIFRAGYKLIVDPRAVTWHYRQPTGGIRSHTDQTMYQHDEGIFQDTLREWSGEKFIFLNCGIGDQIVFKKILPEIKAKYPNLTLVTTSPDVFYDSDIKVIPPNGLFFNQEKHNIYYWMIHNNWKGDLEGAFRKKYL